MFCLFFAPTVLTQLASSIRVFCRCMVERACRKHRACAVFSVRPVRSSEFVQNTAPVQCFGCMVDRACSKHSACAVVSVRIVETTALLLCFGRCGQVNFRKHSTCAVFSVRTVTVANTVESRYARAKFLSKTLQFRMFSVRTVDVLRFPCLFAPTILTQFASSIPYFFELQSSELVGNIAHVQCLRCAK